MIRESYDMEYGCVTSLDWPINYEKLNAKPWQLDLLKLNPEYCCWGPGDEWMSYTEKVDWNSSLVFKSWEEFGPWDINNLNEVVHFYFSVGRKNKICASCGGTRQTPEAKLLSDKWDNGTDGEIPWKYCLQQSDLDNLWDSAVYASFFKEKPSVEQANNVATEIDRYSSHNMIFREICVEAKSKRLGIEHDCTICDGNGLIFTADNAQVSLILWMLHPRFGVSRGIEITMIQEKDLPAIFSFLKMAAKRNEMRFKAIV